MRVGLIFSVAMHAAILFVAALTIVKMTPIPMPQDEIPVDVVTIDEKTSVKAQAPKEEKPEEKPAPAPAPPPEPPKAAPEPPPKEAVLEPQEKPEPKKPEPKPQEKPKPTSEAQKEEKFDPDAIQKLINKEKKKQEKQTKTAEAPAPGTGEPRGPVGAADKDTADIEAFLQNSMRRQVGACWNFPAGAVQPEELVVLVDIRLRPDGNLADAPEVHDSARMEDPYFRAAAEAAVRAVNRCQPYELPADYYDIWKDMTLNFDPRRMVGG